MKVTIILLGILAFAAPSGATQQIAVIVSKKADAIALSVEQVRDIFLGESTFLPNNERAIPGDQSRDAAITQMFYETLAHMTLKEVSVHWARKIFTGRGSPPAEITGGDQKVKEWVQADTRRLGYIYAASVDAEVKALYMVNP